MKAEFKEQYRVFGLNVKFYRKVRNYTQLQLADKLGLDPTHLGRVESAKVGASLDMVYGIAKILDVAPDKLFIDRFSD